MTSRPCILGIALVLLALGPPASAQYMYLDSNADGVHTAADVLHGVGLTVVDIWLDTNHNRDGTVVTCGNPARPLGIFSYLVNLRASGGTVSFSAFTNRVPQMAPLDAGTSNDTDLRTGAFALSPGTSLPPGRYLLGTFSVGVASGTPSIQAVSLGPTNEFTLFGSPCDAGILPNSMVLGYDWFDVDGLTFAPGGGANQAPALLPPANMTVSAGEFATQMISASDAEGQPLTFAKVSGPSFMSVVTTEQGAGTAHGEIRLAPFLSDLGTSVAGVSVSDGTASDQATLHITVTAGPNHPPYLAVIPKLTVIAGQVGKQFFSAGDADGGTLHIVKAGGPEFATVLELASGNGGVSAVLTASPTQCDVGLATTTLSITDGLASVQREVRLEVIPQTVPPDLTPHQFPNPPQSPIAVGLGDLNNDGLLDVVVAHEDPGAGISVFLGMGNGDLAPPVAYAVGNPLLAITVADLNRDGNLDVAGAGRGSTASVLLGRGDGTLLSSTAYATGILPVAIASADLNRDGNPDLVTSNQLSGSISVLLGNGDGTFAAKLDAQVGRRPYTFAVGDYNLDGREDLAVTHPISGSVGSFLGLLPGLGDGSFADERLVTTFALGYPISLLSADWDWDGALDLIITDSYTGAIHTFSGNGDGTFDPALTLANMPVGLYPYPNAIADLNGDGNMDFVSADVPGVLFGDGAGGLASPVTYPGSGFGGIAIAIGDMNSDGRPDVVGVSPGTVGVFLNTFGPGTPSADARAFVRGGHKTLPSAAGAGNLYVQVEPVAGSYTNDQLVLGSLTLHTEGTGSVDEIHSVEPRRVVVADTDRNGVPEIEACFSRRDLATLFDQVHGRRTVTARLTGSLTDARAFCSSVELELIGTGGPSIIASFAPNPFNPQSKLSLTTAREGPAQALLFDIQGRLVRTLFDTPRLAAGPHEFSFDGKNDRGGPLSSGVYFYRVRSTEGVVDGQIVILK